MVSIRQRFAGRTFCYRQRLWRRTIERGEAELIGDERLMLRQFLDYQRQTFLLKINGLDRAQLVRQIPSSSLTLAELANWLQVQPALDPVAPR